MHDREHIIHFWLSVLADQHPPRRFIDSLHANSGDDIDFKTAIKQTPKWQLSNLQVLDQFDHHQVSVCDGISNVSAYDTSGDVLHHDDAYK